MRQDPSGRLASRCETLLVRGVKYNVRRWGSENGRPILFLHGTRDSSITFQFVVEHLQGDWSVVAPDWRGHGQSQWVSQGYWLHEFVADLDVLAGTLFEGRAGPIVGHSLGGNIAGVYAGLRPERLSHLISLDGFGPLVDRVPVDVKEMLSNLLAVPHASRTKKPIPHRRDGREARAEQSEAEPTAGPLPRGAFQRRRRRGRPPLAVRPHPPHVASEPALDRGMGANLGRDPRPGALGCLHGSTSLRSDQRAGRDGTARLAGAPTAADLDPGDRPQLAARRTRAGCGPDRALRREPRNSGRARPWIAMPLGKAQGCASMIHEHSGRSH